jgi:hypothetical protein
VYTCETNSTTTTSTTTTTSIITITIIIITTTTVTITITIIIIIIIIITTVIFTSADIPRLLVRWTTLTIIIISGGVAGHLYWWCLCLAFLTFWVTLLRPTLEQPLPNVTATHIKDTHPRRASPRTTHQRHAKDGPINLKLCVPIFQVFLIHIKILAINIPSSGDAIPSPAAIKKHENRYTKARRKKTFMNIK